MLCRSSFVARKIAVPGIGGIAGIIDCPFCSLSRNPRIPMCDV